MPIKTFSITRFIIFPQCNYIFRYNDFRRNTTQQEPAAIPHTSLENKRCVQNILIIVLIYNELYMYIYITY